eukprot:SAG31_NODE_874_length_11319_cov_3.145098_11_plen_136_part_00
MGAVALLEQSHPDVVQELSTFTEIYFEVTEDGMWKALGSGIVYDYRMDQPKTIMKTYGAHASRAPTGCGVAIMVASAVASASFPLCREAPTAILNVIMAEPSSEIAKLYQCWVRTALLPLFGQIVQMIQERGAAM